MIFLVVGSNRRGSTIQLAWRTPSSELRESFVIELLTSIPWCSWILKIVATSCVKTQIRSWFDWLLPPRPNQATSAMKTSHIELARRRAGADVLHIDGTRLRRCHSCYP